MGDEGEGERRREKGRGVPGSQEGVGPAQACHGLQQPWDQPHRNSEVRKQRTGEERKKQREITKHRKDHHEATRTG